MNNTGSVLLFSIIILSGLVLFSTLCWHSTVYLIDLAQVRKQYQELDSTIDTFTEWALALAKKDFQTFINYDKEVVIQAQLPESVPITVKKATITIKPDASDTLSIQVTCPIKSMSTRSVAGKIKRVIPDQLPDYYVISDLQTSFS